MFPHAYVPLLPRMNGFSETPDDSAPLCWRDAAPSNVHSRPRPLTQAERAIWEAHAAELSGRHHRIYTANIRARIEGERLELAIERLIERHPELRATYRTSAEGPVHRIRTRVEFQLEFVDARRWGAEELSEIVRLTSRQPMDLTASVFRAVLFTRGDAEHVLLLVAHRIAVGAHRLRVMLRELSALYAGDTLPPLPPPAEPTLRRPQHRGSPGRQARPGYARPQALPPGVAVRESAQPHLCQLLDASLARDPDRLALLVGDRPVSCRELDATANRLARCIRSAGVDPRGSVTVELPLSAATAATYLAILRIGAACVPLRLAGGPEASGDAARAVAPSAWVVRGDGRARAGAIVPPIQINLDEISPGLEAVSPQPVGFQGASGDAAVIALAQRGGRTLAVPLSHAAAGKVISLLHAELGLGSADRVLCTGLSDSEALVLDLFLPLVAGATIVFEDDAGPEAPGQLARALERHGITHFRGDARRWAALASIGWRGSPELRALCDARDLGPEIAAFMAPRVRRLHTLYGDSETTVCCATSVVRSGGRVTLGQPLRGSVLRLLDDRLHPVRPGQVGSVFVGGAAVARGYLEDGQGTPELFFPDPFASDGRGLLFRTGDRARLHHDGTLELLRSSVP